MGNGPVAPSCGHIIWILLHILLLVLSLMRTICQRMKNTKVKTCLCHVFSSSSCHLLGGNGPPSAPPSSGAPSGSMSLPGNVPSGSPYTIPPEPTLSQNPLSIMMSRMSKFAMPSSTPLYHDAIKTVASSDDDSPPARSPNLPSVNNNGKLHELKSH